MSRRDARKRRFTPETLEGRMAPSSIGGGNGPPQDVHHDHHEDNGNWEPKPIGHGSTRPNVPSGPVRWQGGEHHEHGDH